jgi:hypothetical protein
MATSSFGQPQFVLPAFGSGAGGWSSQNLYPRLLADVDGGDLADDIVGFAGNGVYVSTNTSTPGSVSFFAPQLVAGSSFWGATGGWSSQDSYPRLLADITGDLRADIVGFSSIGVFLSLNGSFGFLHPEFVPGSSFWGAQTGGWSSQDLYPRELADINHDGKADIVGFASNGVYASFGIGANGGFSAPTFMGGSFWGAQTGGWSSQDTYPRFMADADGDGWTDIVGFAQGGVYVALNHFGGVFFSPTFVQGSSFWGAQTGGWSSQNLYPRSMADVNGDGKPDIVGFAQSGVYVSTNTSTIASVSFAAPELVAGSSFWGASTGGWSSQDAYPRELANITFEITPPRKADIVGFASNGVWTSTSTSTVSAIFTSTGSASSPASVSSGVTNSSPDVALLSQYMAGTFATSSDGDGGTLITDTALTTQPDWLTPPHP